MRITATVQIDSLKNKLDSAIDREFREFAHSQLARMIDRSIPYGYYNGGSVSEKSKGQGGVLAASRQITPDYLAYVTPYAHYQYTGLVMNMVTKKYTGKELKYTTQKHPEATKEWDKALMRNKGDEFIKLLTDELTRRLNS